MHLLSKRIINYITAISAVMCFYSPLQAQNGDTISHKGFWYAASEYNRERGRIMAFSTASIYAGTMMGLYSVWYKDYPLSGFHRFNDNEEWLQIDKVGHCGSAYYLSRWNSELMGWTGLSPKKSALWGAGISYTFLLSVEMLDGHSKEWGFSTGDLIANTIGTGLFLGQALGWKEQRISFKLSYNKSPLANQRPSIFGSNIAENVLKDYNGQTYWLSFNLADFMKKSSLPPWLNIAVGYGANNMLTANAEETPEGLTYPGERYRQFYISPDIEWSKIPAKSGALKALFKVLGCIKIPAPALEYRKKSGLVFHGMYF